MSTTLNHREVTGGLSDFDATDELSHSLVDSRSGGPIRSGRTVSCRGRLLSCRGRLLSWCDGPWRVALLLAVVSLVMWRKVALSPQTTTVGVGGRDFHFYVWSLDVIARGMFRWGPSLRSSVIYPMEGGVPLTGDTTILGFGFLLAPVTRLFGPVFSLNLVMLSALPLNGAAAFWSYRKVLKCDFFGSLLGAVTFAASPYVMGHSLGHANLVHLWWFPLAMGLIVPAVADSATRRPLVRAVLGGGVLGLGMLLGSELVAIAAVVVVPWLVFLAVRLRPKINVRPLFAAGGCALLLSAPVVWGTIGDANHFTGVHQPMNVYVTDVSNVVIPTSDSVLGHVLDVRSLASRWSGNAAETTGYLSIFGVALVVVALQRRVRTASRRFAGLCAWALVLSLGPYMHIGGVVSNIPLLPGMVLAVIPLLGSILPGRISFVIFAALGATIALAFKQTESVKSFPANSETDPDSVFRARRVLLCKVLACLTVVATLPPLTMSSFNVATTFGLQALSRRGCGVNGDASRAVPVPRDEGSYDALSWQVRGNYQVQLVRARYFARDYPLHGRVLLLDQFVNVAPQSVSALQPRNSAMSPVTQRQVLTELRGLHTNCVVAAPALIDSATRKNLDVIFGESNRSGGLDYWSVG